MREYNGLDPKLYDEIISRVKNGEPLDKLLERYDSYTVREVLGLAGAQYSGKTPAIELFEKPELFKNVKTIIDPNLEGALGSVRFNVDPKTKYYNPEDPITKTLQDASDKATDIHENQHIYDLRSRPEIKQSVEPKNILKSKSVQEGLYDLGQEGRRLEDFRGLDNATLEYAKHFKPDAEGRFGKLKEILQLQDIVHGRPLKMIAPILKAAGIGALGYQALGIGQKAAAGEFGEAGLEAADMATDYLPVVGQVKDAIRPTELGNADLPPEEMKQRELFNKTRQRLLNK
jgi:hypothetical protein